MADVVRVAGALSNEKRFEILQMLYKGSLVSCCDRFEFGEQGVCVADVVGALGMSQSTISHHLSVLEEAGLIRRETRGLWTCYFPNPSAIEEFTVRIRQQLGVDMVSGGECGEVCNCKPR